MAPIFRTTWVKVSNILSRSKRSISTVGYSARGGRNRVRLFDPSVAYPARLFRVFCNLKRTYTDHRSPLIQPWDTGVPRRNIRFDLERETELLANIDRREERLAEWYTGVN